VPSYLFKHTQEFFPNNLDALERTLRLNKLRGGTAAVFIEPVGPESGTRPLDKNFNKEAEKLCQAYHEVVTGFRIGMA
jgi:glutamate-1-semialdehyde 2,1-aminomutase